MEYTACINRHSNTNLPSTEESQKGGRVDQHPCLVSHRLPNSALSLLQRKTRTRLNCDTLKGTCPLNLSLRILPLSQRRSQVLPPDYTIIITSHRGEVVGRTEGQTNPAHVGGSSWHASLAWHTPFASFIDSQAASKAVVLPFHSMCAWYPQRLDTKAACMLVALTGLGARLSSVPRHPFKGYPKVRTF